MGLAPRGVLVLTLNSSLGGTEKSLVSLYSRLDKHLFSPCIVTLIGDGSLVRLAHARGLEAFHLGMRGPLDIRVLFRLAEIFRRREVSILHTYLYHTAILGRLLGWAKMVPEVVCSQRSTDDWRTGAHVLLDRFTQRLVHCYVANCQAVADRLKKVERIAPDKIRVIPTGIEPLRLVDPAFCMTLRKNLFLADDATVIGTVGNLRPAKGHAILVEAAKKIVAEFPKAVFVWVGEGPLREELQKSIREAGLEGHFRLAGFQENTAGYYEIFDLFVLPSLWEGRPLALLEAMSKGLPIVSTRVGGVAEMLSDGVHARLVASHDSRALRDAVLSLLRAPEMAARMGKKAQERFDQEKSLEAYVSQTQNLYGILMEEKSRR